MTLPVTVVHSDGSAYDLSGAVSAIIGFKYKDTDDETFFQRQWDLTDDVAGEAEFSFIRADVADLPVGSYIASIQFIDDDTDVEDTILGPSRVWVNERTASFDDPVTVLPTQLPLAQGPPGNFLAAALTTDGLAGDTVVIDVALSPGDGESPYRLLADGGDGYVLSQTYIVGYLVQDYELGGVDAVVQTGGYMAASVSGLSGADAGRVTVDLTSGRLRAALAGEPTYGFCDGSGNVHLLTVGDIQ